MFELMFAYILYETDADSIWWAAFFAFLVMDFLFAIARGYREG
jgi:hypothetical protein